MAYKDPAKQRQFQAKWASDKRKRLRARLWALKEGPCADCGQVYPPWVMQFDHVRGTKEGGVSRMAVGASLERLMAEVEKCELVCGNCHLNRTYLRKEELRGAAGI